MKKALCIFSLTAMPLFALSQTAQKQINFEYNSQEDNACESAKLFVVRATNFSKTDAYYLALTALGEGLAADPAHEHIIGFGKDSLGNIIASAASTGAKNSSIVPSVSNAFTDLHNHPKNTPPSSGDLYGLIYLNKKNNNYAMRFVVTPSRIVYAFVITDTTAARIFAERFPPQKLSGYSPLFPEALLNEYRDIIYKYKAAEEVAMAYVLAKYHAGVALLKQDVTGDFKKLKASVTGSGDDLIFAVTNCQ